MHHKKKMVYKHGRFTYKGIPYQIDDNNYHNRRIPIEELLEMITDGRAYEKQRFPQKHIGAHNVFK